MVRGKMAQSRKTVLKIESFGKLKKQFQRKKGSPRYNKNL